MQRIKKVRLLAWVLALCMIISGFPADVMIARADNEPQGDPDAVGNNEFRVFYNEEYWHDDEAGQDVQHAFVRIGDQIIRDREAKGFESNQTLNFILNPHSNRVNCDPIVIIRRGQGEEWEWFSNRADYAIDGSHVFPLSKNADGSQYEFSYVPNSNQGFYVEVTWSDYDAFWGNEDSFVIDTRAFGNRAVVTFDKDSIEETSEPNPFNDPNEGFGVRKRFANSVCEDGSKLTVTFTPKQGQYIARIGANVGEDGWYRDFVTWTPDPERENEISIYAADSGFIDHGDGSFSYVYDHVPNNCGANFDVDCRDVEVENGKFKICYNEEYWDDQCHAIVEVNGTVRRHEEEVAFTKNQTLKFTLKPAEKRVDCDPIVLLRKRGEEFSNRDWICRDEDHRLTLTKNSDGSVYEFTYVPTNDAGFTIDVMWSDYDFWWGDEETFVVETRDGNHLGRTASVSFNPEVSDENIIYEPNPRDLEGEGFGIRRRFQKSIFDGGKQLTITFAPLEGYYVQRIGAHIDDSAGYVNYVTWTPDPNRNDEVSIYDAGNGFTDNGDGTFTYVLTQAPERNGLNFDVDCREIPGSIRINSDGTIIEYRLDNQADYTLLEGDRIERSVLAGANSITLRVTNFDDWRRSISIYWDERNGRMSNVRPLVSEDEFTLYKGDGWKDYEIEVRNQDRAYNNHFVFNQAGWGETSVSYKDEDAEWWENYEFTVGQTETFSVDGAVYKVVAWKNNGDEEELQKKNGVYEFTPSDEQGVEIKIYSSKERYDVDHLHPDWNNDEYEANYRFWTNDSEEPGGTVSHGSEGVVREATCEDETRLILKNAGQIDLTIRPNDGFDYVMIVDSVDVTDTVKENGNVFSWDVSNREDIEPVEVFFNPLPGAIWIQSSGAKVEYRTDDGAYVEAESNYIGRDVLLDADQIELLVTPGEETIRGLGLYWEDEEGCHSYVCEYKPGVAFVLPKGDGWKDYDFEVIPWDCAYTGHYIFSRRGWGDLTVIVDGRPNWEAEWGTNYEATPDREISFRVIGTAYKVFARKNNREAEELFENEGRYRYVPDDEQGFEIIVFASKVSYDVESMEWDDDEFDFWIRFWSDDPEGQKGSISFDDAGGKLVKYVISEDQARLILKEDATFINLTVDPMEGYAYCLKINGIDVAESARLNHNVYAIDISEEIPNVEVIFFAGEPLTGTVSLGGAPRYGSELSVTVSDTNNTGTLSYQWTRDNVAIEGANATSYLLTAEDIGHKVECVVSSSVQVGHVSGNVECVNKAEGPAAPVGLEGFAATEKGAADGRITGTSNAMEYSVDENFGVAENVKKISGTEVTGLLAGTYYVRIAETETTQAGGATAVIVSEGPERIPLQTMYRLYNPNSGEHFYTASIDERETLVGYGWNFEGDAWQAPVTSNTPVYRLYNPNAGDHHYTTSMEEKENLVNVGWNYEGIGWYSDDSLGVPLYRLYNPNATSGAHHYTASEEERDHLASIGWNYEGVGWHGGR